MSRKKSLYEILEVPANAPHAEIRASYERLLKSLESRQSALSRDDYTMQLRLLRVAYSTLSTPMSRASYDVHLAARDDPAKPSSALLVTTPAASGSTGVMRADALMMRAEAIALRADALGLKADLLSGNPQVNGDATGNPIVSRVLSNFKTALLILGTLAAVGMVFKVVLLMVYRQHEAPVGARSQTDDKVFLQEYYQTYGVRPASRAEAELMDAERSKNEAARRAQQRIDDKAEKGARAERDFEEAARRRGEQVSRELQYSEERARQAQLQEAREKEYEMRRKEEAEAARIENNQEKWKNDLRSPSGY
jgi:hypothetical protein